MSARRESHDPTLALVRRELKQPVSSASQLKRAAGLEALAFQPDRRAVDLTLDERRPLDEPLNPLRRIEDVATADLSRLC